MTMLKSLRDSSSQGFLKFSLEILITYYVGSLFLKKPLIYKARTNKLMRYNSPIIITGAVRTGSTILTRIISDCSNVYITNEMQSLTCIVAPIPFNRKLVGNYNTRPRIKKKAEELIKLVPVLRWDKLDTYWDKLLEEELYGDKHWFYVYILDYLFKTYDNPKLIVTLRDPRDVWLSLRRHYDENKIAGITNYPTVESAINAAPHNSLGTKINITTWLKKWYKERKNYSYLEVYYRDMCDNHVRILKDVSKYLNISYSELKTSYDSMFQPTHYQTWRTERPNINNKINETYKELMKEFNYD